MKIERPEEIEEARRLFLKSEKFGDHGQRTKDFSEAIDVLNDYLNQNPNSIHLDYIKNIKFSFMRSLLESLSKLTALDIDDLYYYTTLFLKEEIDKEADLVIKEHPNLKNNYLNLVNEAIKCLKRNMPNTGASS